MPALTDLMGLMGLVHVMGLMGLVQVVAIGAGTAHRPSAEVQQRPAEALNDCHAEVLARRSFVKFLLDEIEKIVPAPTITPPAPAKSSADDSGVGRHDAMPAMIASDAGAGSIFCRSNEGGFLTTSPFCLKPGIRFHLYIRYQVCACLAIQPAHTRKFPRIRHD